MAELDALVAEANISDLISRRLPIAFGVRSLAGLGLLAGFALVTYQLTSRDLTVVLLALAGAVLVTMAVYARPDTMLLVLLACSIVIPSEFGIKVGILPSVGPTRGLVACYLAGAFLRALIHRRLDDEGRLDFPLGKSVLIYLICAMISSLLSVDVRASLYSTIARDLVEQFVLFYLIVYFLEKPGFWDRLKKWVFYATLIVLAWSFIEEVTRFNPYVASGVVFPDAGQDFRSGLLRVQATFYHPIAYGSYLNIIFPFVLAAYLNDHDLRSKLKFVLGAMILASIITVSRAPWLCLAMEIGLFYLWRSYKSVYRLFLIIVLACLGFMAMVYAYNNNQTINRLFRPLVGGAQNTTVEESSTVKYRIDMVRAMNKRLSQEHRWMFGFGPMTFHLAKVEIVTRTHRFITGSPDNHIARMYFEFGWVGFGAFWLLLFGSFHYCIQAVRRTSGPDKAWALACLAAVAGFVIVNFTVSVFITYPISTLFWTCVGAAYKMSKGELVSRTDQETAEAPVAPPPARPLLSGRP